MEVELLDVRRGSRGDPPGQGGTLTGGPLALLVRPFDEPIGAGSRRVRLAAWLLLTETVLAGMTLVLDSNEAQSAIHATAADLSDPSTTAFALINGPLFILPVLALLVMAAMAVGIRPRGGRWFTIPAQLAAVLVLLISLRGVLEVVGAILMAIVAIYAELLLFRRPRRVAAG